MTRLLAALQHTAAILREGARPFALVGGLAVSVRVEPRFTRDIDLAVALADDAAAEQLVGELQARGFALQLSLEQRALVGANRGKPLRVELQELLATRS